MNVVSITKHIRTTVVFLSLGQQHKAFAHITGIARVAFIISWEIGIQILSEVAESARRPKRASAAGKDLVEAPFRLAKSKLPRPSIIFDLHAALKTKDGSLVSIF